MEEKIEIKCSFCQKLETMVAWLVGGQPGAYICNECVVACVHTMNERIVAEMKKK